MGIEIKQQPLKVYLSDISPHSQAILEFFIGSTGGKSFTLVPTPADAEIYMTDFDYPGSREHWETEHAVSAKPCIVLSIEDPQNQYVEWVAKPITAQALISAAKAIADRKGKDVATTSEASSKTTQSITHTPPPLPKIATTQSPFRRTIAPNTPAIHTRAPDFQQTNNTAPLFGAHNTDTHIDEHDGDTSVAIKTKKETTTSIVSETRTASTKQQQEVKQDAAENQTQKEGKREKIKKKQHTTAKPEQKNTLKTPIETKTQKVSEREKKAAKKASITQAEQAQKRWDLLCGEHSNISPNALKSNETYVYNCENFFQGTLIAGLRLAKQTGQVVQIKYEPHQFYVCHDEYLVFSPLAPDSDDYTALCKTKVKPGQVNLHILTSPESADIRERIHSDANFTYDLENFIWTSCLLTSQGRVPSSLNCEDKYLLKQWPNFTRIENFPFAMKIAARWQKKPYKITEIAREMDIPLRYIIAFYNGTIGLSLFETDMSKVQQKSNIKPKKSNGLIARLFGRLTQSESPS